MNRPPVEFDIPSPLPSLNVYAHLHWAERYKLDERWRVLLQTYWPPRLRGDPPKHGIRLVIWNFTQRGMDVDNICVKPLLDALGPRRIRSYADHSGVKAPRKLLVAAGWLPDDGPKYVRSLTLYTRTAKVPFVRVRLIFLSEPPRRLGPACFDQLEILPRDESDRG